MKVTFPRIKFGLTPHDVNIVQDIVLWYIRVCVLVSPYAWYKIHEILKLKGWFG